MQCLCFVCGLWRYTNVFWLTDWLIQFDWLFLQLLIYISTKILHLRPQHSSSHITEVSKNHTVRMHSVFQPHLFVQPNLQQHNFLHERKLTKLATDGIRSSSPIEDGRCLAMLIRYLPAHCEDGDVTQRRQVLQTSQVIVQSLEILYTSACHEMSGTQQQLVYITLQWVSEWVSE